MSAGALIVQEAGGTTTDGSGGAFNSRRGSIIASNGRIHTQMAEVVRSRNRTQ